MTILHGIDTIIPEDGALAKLEKGGLNIKFGADPSAPDLHLGHLVILNKLRQLQDLGHTVTFIIGDFTAMIGDPTGKSTTRPALTKSDVIENAKSYQEQVFKILDKNKTKVVYNSEWLDKLTATDMIALAAKSTVARMLERDDFSKRFKSNTAISIHEFLYPLIQGYDSVALKSDVELGGTDQTFNLLMGRQLQKDAGLPEQMIITLPILEGLDGTQKMSKSLNNHIGLTDSPKDIFGKTMSIPDELITRYFSLLTNTPKDTIEQMQTQMKNGANPRDFKIELAKTLVARLHSQDAANAAHSEFLEIFANKGVPDTIPEIKIPPSPISIVDIIAEYNILPSKKEARRMVEQGAVSIDDEKITDPTTPQHPTTGQVLKVGKRKFYQFA
ncbi:MAG: tyrosine--tRNA ligase [bacterium]|nr:tyrosine--tRNA ligase [bacterium]